MTEKKIIFPSDYKQRLKALCAENSEQHVYLTMMLRQELFFKSESFGDLYREDSLTLVKIFDQSIRKSAAVMDALISDLEVA